VSPRLAITLGDPRGIGAEVSEKALLRLLASQPGGDILILGAAQFADSFASQFSRLAPSRVSFTSVGSWDGTERSAGEVAVAAIRRATEMALSGDVQAIVTAPIHKPALKATGVDAPGHTELLQELTGAADVGMLMAAERTRVGGPLRVLLATTHLALRDVPAALSADLLVRQATLLHAALRDEWGISHPRIAFCAFNPHASDGGLFGDEEARLYAPALERLRGLGLDVSPPTPADTVFTRALEGEFDAVVAPYHDVGLAAFKTVSFRAGVNVTLGLPFVRTSPDHGTAFDLAGKGLADEGSMLEAIELAALLAQRRAARTGRIRAETESLPSAGSAI
jgi:4-hydroxythreonine-4-phosphate dehydrogenase